MIGVIIATLPDAISLKNVIQIVQSEIVGEYHNL